jgi:hypothetical protein
MMPEDKEPKVGTGVSPAQIEQWKQQYGDVYEIRDDGFDGEQLLFYFRKPGRPQLSRFTKEAMKDAFKAVNNLVFGCLLHPSEEVVRRLFDEKPGLAIAVGNELQRIVGTNQDFLSRKL